MSFGLLSRCFMLVPGILLLVSCAGTLTSTYTDNTLRPEDITTVDASHDLLSMDLVFTVGLPVDAVFAYLVDPASAPYWQSDIIKLEKMTDGPLRVGSIFLTSRRSLWGDYQFERDITDFKPLKTFGFHNNDKTLEFNISYVLDSVENGTRIAVAAHFKRPEVGRYRFIPQCILKYAIKRVFLRHNNLLLMNLRNRY